MTDNIKMTCYLTKNGWEMTTASASTECSMTYIRSECKTYAAETTTSEEQ